MADDHCPRCGTGLDGAEDAWPWCDLCWQEMHSGPKFDKDTVIQNILDAQAQDKMVLARAPMA